MSSTIGHGNIILSFGYGPFKTHITLHGGPFLDKPKSMLGVNLRAEKPGFGDVELPIKDFGIPKEKSTQRALRNAFRLAMGPGEIYAGCAGGIGRTGLFLALAAKMAGETRPLEYVRDHYLPRAVETREQIVFLEDFPEEYLAEIRSDLNRRGCFRYFTKLIFG